MARGRDYTPDDYRNPATPTPAPPVVTKNVIRRQGSPGMPRGYLLVVRAAHRPSRRRLRYRCSRHRGLCGLRLVDDLILCSGSFS
jgi:hypothetical protein